MACTALTKGRGLDCNRISGGIKNIYFAVLDEVSAIPQTAGEITDLEMGTNDLYRYTMPLGVASISDTIVGSLENGTIYYAPTASIILNRLTKEDQNQIKLLGQTKTIIFAELNQQLSNGNNVIVGMGSVNGMSLDSGTMDSGAAWGDRNGYTLNFSGLEALPFAMVADYTADPFDNAAFTFGTIEVS